MQTLRTGPPHALAAPAAARRAGRVAARHRRCAAPLRATAEPPHAPQPPHAADEAAQKGGARRRAILRASGTATHALSADAPRLAAFLDSHAGHSSCLNLEMFRRAPVAAWERLSHGVYRCQADTVKLLKYEVQPTLELAVTVPPAGDGTEALDAGAAASASPSEPPARTCEIALRSSRLEGSAAVRAQSEKFSASARHVITWRGPALHSAVELTVELELFGGGLGALLPRAAVERPGSAVLQRMVDRNLAPFLAQLERDYRAWDADAARGGGSGAPDAATPAA